MKKVIFTFLFIGLCTGIQAQCPGVFMSPNFAGPHYDTGVDSAVTSITDSICDYYEYMCKETQSDNLYYAWMYFSDTFTLGYKISTYTGFSESISVVVITNCNTVIFDTCYTGFVAETSVLPHIGGQLCIHIAMPISRFLSVTVQPRNTTPFNATYNRNFFYNCNVVGYEEPRQGLKDKPTYIDFQTMKIITNPIHGYLYFVPEHHRIERFMKME